MGVVAIACYRPKNGREKELLALTKTHVPTLLKEGLVENRPAICGRARDGTLVEVFVWKSQDSIKAAHSNAAVGALWKRYGELADFVMLRDLSESAQLFAEFEFLPLAEA